MATSNGAPPEAGAFFDTAPPYSPEAEVTVLGAMLIDPDAASLASESLAGGMFYREAHNRIFRAMLALMDADQGLDPITLSEQLRTTKELEAVGGIDYIAELISAVPTASNVAYHIRIVRDKAVMRRLVEVSTAAIRDVYDMGDRSATDVVGEAEARIMALGENAVTQYAPIKERLWAALEEIEARQAQPNATPGIRTGLVDLDRKLLGLHPGELTVVAGRPSMGKTALALGWAINAAISEATPALIFSFEMTSMELLVRALAHEARVELQALRGARSLTTDEARRLSSAAGHLNGAPIYIDDASDTDVRSVVARTRRAVKADGVKIVVIDYLQLMSARAENRRLEIDVITREAKRMARTMDVAVVLVSQLSRGPENRTDKRPILSDLRESGGVEQDADNVVMVYRPEYYMNPQQLEEAKGGTGLTELIVPKQRNGPTGTVRAVFLKQYTRFENLYRDGPQPT